MLRPVKYVEKGVTKAAKGLWNTIQFLDRKFEPNKAFTPNWSEKPVLKTWEKSKPPLGWPRQTDSLCPKCVVEARDQIINGDVDYNVLRNQKVGEIKATIVERDEIAIRKQLGQAGELGGMVKIVGIDRVEDR